MDQITAARQEVALDIQHLAEEFERSDESAFRRARIGCWVIIGGISLFLLLMLLLGASGYHMALFWIVMVLVVWGTYFLSSRRQREQTRRLRDLATKWSVPAAVAASAYP